jgi:uncharacterized protein YbjT (DUF2867 family)
VRIVIAGGHGQIALRLERLLAGRGHEVAGLIRKPEQADDVRAAGAEPVVVDLEAASVDEVATAVEGADAVVFAAGAGPGSGNDRKDTVDRAGAVLFADAAERKGVRRYVIVSSMGANANHAGDGVFDVYLRAKGAADDALRERPGLDWTVLRPGGLTNDQGTGRVQLAESVTGDDVPTVMAKLLATPGAAGLSVTRDDVAAVIADLLATPGTAGLTLELVGGSTPVADAVNAVAKKH